MWHNEGMETSSGKLYICPTPLGNLGDMTMRALEALRAADVVCAEDTRVTGKLLAAYDIQKRLERLDENLMATHSEIIIGRVLAGETVVFCSDAGMPGISDPGARLVNAAHAAGAPVEVLPGASAVTTAYVASGFSVPQFYFGGFFPRKDAERHQALISLSALDAALVFYESPKRLASALEVIAAVFPHRRVAVCRELTKLHEEVFEALSPQVAEEFKVRAAHSTIKGEVVIVIDAASHAEQEDKALAAQTAARERATELVKEGSHSHKDIVVALQAEFGLARNEAYRIAHEQAKPQE